MRIFRRICGRRARLPDLRRICSIAVIAVGTLILLILVIVSGLWWWGFAALLIFAGIALLNR